MAIPHLVAHRGFMDQYPENTLIGIETAFQCGGCYVEFDVQCTADGKFVVFHDTELERTTGVSGNVFEMTQKELKKIRAHEPNRFSLAFFNQRIPTLEEVVRLLQHYPKVTAFIEIKEESLQQFGIKNIMPALLKQLEIIHQQCVIISFDAAAINYVKDHSDFQAGWVLNNYDDETFSKANQLKPEYLIINHRKIPTNEAPWQGEWHWMIYDVTDPELAIHYASHNIPLIETRDICSMLEHPVLALNTCQHDL
ncbi:MAG: glycerophosphodiester phosphodiesterase family protein [Gammaproteobacteria bacterium]|nr:glycerophosphodiester phosphodiesterase family protein [Gammaproteobacteria bacterium]